MAKAKAEKGGLIVLKEQKMVTIKVPIIGLSSLIMHKWAGKAIRMMEEKQAGTASRKKEARDPDYDAAAALYRMPNDSSIPAMTTLAFKSAIVGGCRCFENIDMTQAKRWIFVDGDAVAIVGRCEFRTDTVRLSGGVADLRYRPEFFDWATVLTVSYNGSTLAQESVLNLINAGGFDGVGEWRPSSPKSSNGTHGRFRVGTQAEYDLLLKKVGFASIPADPDAA